MTGTSRRQIELPCPRPLVCVCVCVADGGGGVEGKGGALEGERLLWQWLYSRPALLVVLALVLTPVVVLTLDGAGGGVLGSLVTWGTGTGSCPTGGYIPGVENVSGL